MFWKNDFDFINWEMVRSLLPAQRREMVSCIDSDIWTILKNGLYLTQTATTVGHWPYEIVVTIFN
jgi:hypothetical protein